MEIKVLGPGCQKCNEVAKIMADAIATTGVTASIEKVSDFQQTREMSFSIEVRSSSQGLDTPVWCLSGMKI